MKWQQEAERLLTESGLLDILREYGEPRVIGSASMDLMVWPDLDIDVIHDDMDIRKLHRLTCTLLERFAPLWYEAKEEVNDEGKTVWFHGMEAVVNGTRWNFDIWFFDRETVEKAEACCAGIRETVGRHPAYREVILQLKRELIDRGLYVFGKYTSMDVYRAVLEQGITDIDTFLAENPLS